MPWVKANEDGGLKGRESRGFARVVVHPVGCPLVPLQGTPFSFLDPGHRAPLAPSALGWSLMARWAIGGRQGRATILATPNKAPLQAGASNEAQAVKAYSQMGPLCHKVPVPLYGLVPLWYLC